MRFGRVAQFALYVALSIVTACFAVDKPVFSSPPAASAQIWNLKDADIRAVIQTVSLLSGKTFIIDPRVQGKITLLSQNPMPPEELYQVFLSMLHLLGYSAVSVGNVVKVVPAASANIFSRQIASAKHPGEGNEVVVRVIPVNHVSAMELVPVLRPLMSESASVTAYAPSNTLILAGTAGNITRLVAMISQMDKANANPVAVVKLRYADAKKIVAVIQKLQTGNAMNPGTQNAVLAADEEDNSVLVSGNLANQLMTRNLIRKLDQQGSSGDDTKVVVLNYLSAKKLAPILAKVASGMNASAQTSDSKGKTGASVTTTDGGDISVQAENDSNAVIMHAPKAMLSGLMRVIQRLDNKPQEVLVEAIIVKVDENLLNKLGVVWGTSDNDASGAAAAAAAAVAAGGVAPPVPTSVSANYHTGGTFPLQPTYHGIGFLPNSSLTALLHVLKTNGSSDVLSTPSVVVLNNQKAMISEGQNLGMANQSYQGVPATPASGNTTITPFNRIQRQDVALSLAVTPHVSPNQMIQLALEQKDDTVADGGSTDNPTLNISKIKTSVLVKSGDILVLGGLLDNEQRKTTQKVPILGDIPIIGHLFRYDTRNLKKKSLMVFIRPIVMSKQVGHAQTMHRYDYIRHQEIDMATKSSSQLKMPMLPEIRKTHVRLPKPVNTMDIPSPRDADT